MKITARDVTRIRRQCLDISPGLVELVMEGDGQLMAYIHDNTAVEPIRCYIGWVVDPEGSAEVAVIPG